MERVINDIKSGNLLHLAFESEKGNKYSEAIKLYNEAIELNNGNYCAYLSLGALYERISDEAKAVDTYKKGINLARTMNNKQIEKEFSYTLLGLLD